MPSLTPREVERRLLELLASTIVDFKPVDAWVHNGDEVRLPFFTRASPDEVQRFETRLSLPQLGGARWLLRVDISGNGLLIIDGEPYQGVDEQHRLAVLEPGEREVVLEATPRRLFGETPWFFAFMGSCLTAVLWEGFNLALSLLDALRLAHNRP
ncbi:MAG: hypothetical protein DRJ67_07725, partial [Thermoprotei archaeon]